MLGVITNGGPCVFLKYSDTMWLEWGESDWKKHNYFKEKTDKLISPMELIKWMD